jgi:predicted MFS family arabinose efflux permease
MRGRAGDRMEGRADGASDPVAARASQRSWLTGRYLALLLGVAVPMNATMVIYTWYLAPLMLSDSGSGPAEIARVLLLYNLAIVLFGPTVARLADGRPGPAILLTAGAVISGASLLSLTLWGGFWAIACAVAGVGIGQVLMQTPIYALALRLTGGLGPGIDALRLIERLGAIAGLAVSAVLLGEIGAQASLRLLGFAVLAGVVVFVIVTVTGRTRSP